MVKKYRLLDMDGFTLTSETSGAEVSMHAQ